MFTDEPLNELYSKLLVFSSSMVSSREGVLTTSFTSLSYWLQKFGRLSLSRAEIEEYLNQFDPIPTRFVVNDDFNFDNFVASLDHAEPKVKAPRGQAEFIAKIFYLLVFYLNTAQYSEVDRLFTYIRERQQLFGRANQDSIIFDLFAYDSETKTFTLQHLIKTLTYWLREKRISAANLTCYLKLFVRSLALPEEKQPAIQTFILFFETLLYNGFRRINLPLIILFARRDQEQQIMRFRHRLVDLGISSDQMRSIGTMPTISMVIHYLDSLMADDVEASRLPLGLLFAREDQDDESYRYCLKLLKTGLSVEYILRHTSVGSITATKFNKPLLYADYCRPFNACVEQLIDICGAIPDDMQRLIPQNLPARLYVEGNMAEAADRCAYLPAVAACIKLGFARDIRGMSTSLEYLLAVERAHIQGYLTLPETIIALYNDTNDEEAKRSTIVIDICTQVQLPYCTEWLLSFLSTMENLANVDVDTILEIANYSLIVCNRPELCQHFLRQLLDLNLDDTQCNTKKHLEDAIKAVSHTTPQRFKFFGVHGSSITMETIVVWLLSLTGNQRVNLNAWYHTTLGKMVLKEVIEITQGHSYEKTAYKYIFLVLGDLDPQQYFSEALLALLRNAIDTTIGFDTNIENAWTEFCQSQQKPASPSALLNCRRICGVSRHEADQASLEARVRNMHERVEMQNRLLLNRNVVTLANIKLEAAREVYDILGLAFESDNWGLVNACFDYIKSSDVSIQTENIMRLYLHDVCVGKMTEARHQRWLEIIVRFSHHLSPQTLFPIAIITQDWALIYTWINQHGSVPGYFEGWPQRMIEQYQEFFSGRNCSSLISNTLPLWWRDIQTKTFNEIVCIRERLLGLIEILRDELIANLPPHRFVFENREYIIQFLIGERNFRKQLIMIEKDLYDYHTTVILLMGSLLRFASQYYSHLSNLTFHEKADEYRNILKKYFIFDGCGKVCAESYSALKKILLGAEPSLSDQPSIASSAISAVAAAAADLTTFRYQGP